MESTGRGRKGTMSAEARAKIAAAQRKRWAEWKSGATKPKGTTRPKRKFSPEGLARIRAATKLRWARYRKEQARAGRK
jgi:hypothetical protein